MKSKPLYRKRIWSVVASTGFVALSVAASAQELPTIFPGVTVIPERSIPAPPGLSPEMLEVVMDRQIPPEIPAPDTVEGWMEMQEIMNAPQAEAARAAAEINDVSYESTEIAGVSVYTVTPSELNPRWGNNAFVHVHGGAWVFGGGEASLRESIWLSSGLGVRVITVDYRKPPLHPSPAAVEDVIAVWMDVTSKQDAARTALFGTSAGGNIALATTLRLKDMEKPLPGAIFAGTPATDLENVSDTWRTMMGLDPLGGREPGGLVAGSFEQYIGGADPAHPYLSPVNGNLDGFPPTILISGTRDMLLSDTVRMHRALRAADVAADLHVYDGQVHGDYMRNLLMPVPEAADAQHEIFNFFDAHLE